MVDLVLIHAHKVFLNVCLYIYMLIKRINSHVLIDISIVNIVLNILTFEGMLHKM